MLVVQYRKVFFLLSALVIGASIGAVVFFGVNFGIDFTGGEIAEVTRLFFNETTAFLTGE